MSAPRRLLIGERRTQSFDKIPLEFNSQGQPIAPSPLSQSSESLKPPETLQSSPPTTSESTSTQSTPTQPPLQKQNSISEIKDKVSETPSTSSTPPQTPPLLRVNSNLDQSSVVQTTTTTTSAVTTAVATSLVVAPVETKASKSDLLTSLRHLFDGSQNVEEKVALLVALENEISEFRKQLPSPPSSSNSSGNLVSALKAGGKSSPKQERRKVVRKVSINDDVQEVKTDAATSSPSKARPSSERPDTTPEPPALKPMPVSQVDRLRSALEGGGKGTRVRSLNLDVSGGSPAAKADFLRKINPQVKQNHDSALQKMGIQTSQFSIKVKLPDGTYEIFSFPINFTVDHVKRELFSKRLPDLKPHYYLLGLSPSELLDVEFVKFSLSHKTFLRKILSGETILIQIYKKSLSRRLGDDKSLQRYLRQKVPLAPSDLMKMESMDEDSDQFNDPALSGMPSVITPEVAQYLESALDMDDGEEFPIPTEKAEVIPIHHGQKADVEAIEADLLRRAEVDLKLVADKKDWSVAKPEKTGESPSPRRGVSILSKTRSVLFEKKLGPAFGMKSIPIMLRCRANPSDQLMVFCPDGVTISEFLTESSKLLRDFAERSESLVKQNGLIYTRLKEKLYVLNCSDQLTKTSFINDALAQSALPIFNLATGPPPKDAAAAEELAAQLPEDEAISFDSLVQLVSNAEEEEKEKAKLHERREREQREREIKEKEIRERDEQRLKEKVEKAAKAAAEAAEREAQERGSIPIEFRIPDGSTITFECSMSATFETIKQQLWEKLASKGTFSSTSHFLKITGSSFIVGEEEEKAPIYKFPFINFCKGKNLPPSFSVIPRNEQQKEKLVSMKIGAIIGRPCLWRIEDTDAADCRIKMYRIFGDKPTHWKAATPVEVTDIAWPANLSSNFQVKVHIGTGDDVSSKTIACNGEQTSSELMAVVCKKVERDKKILDPAEYIFKISGMEQYFVKPVKLKSVVYIRERLKRKKGIALSVVKKTSLPPILEVSEDKTTFTEDEKRLLDRSSGLPAFGTDRIVSIFELKRKLEVCIIRLEGGDFTNLIGSLPSDKNSSTMLSIEVGVYHGGVLISPLVQSQAVPYGMEIKWNEWLRTNIPLCNIPEESRLCITLYANKDTPLANVNCQLFDYKDRLLSGPVTLKMWTGSKANPIGTCVENLASRNPPKIHLWFPKYPQAVGFPTIKANLVDFVEYVQPNKEESERLESLWKKDPLYRLNVSDKELLWKFREYGRKVPSSLVKILQSVNWTDSQAVSDTYRLLETWSPLSPVDALELLDAKFANRQVREYAVTSLNNLSDPELRDYLLQLVQVLKYEPNHISALGCWLMRRALRNQIQIGHAFFWHLQAEMHVPEISERFGLLLEVYLRACGEQREELLKQMEVIKKLKLIAGIVKDTPSSRRKQTLEHQLRTIPFPEKFQLPLNPTVVAKGVIPERCRCMDSAKAPLWLVFENDDPLGDNVFVIFKSGDDLRQDILTLQMLNIMDKLWKNAGLDLHLTPYGCIATGEEMGMIEIVLDSETTANIQKAAGGVTAAFRQTPLANWLKERNPSESDYEMAVENFTRSCAGYCVATYVLGIGDRHNDNIMVNKHGFLFHIDFGHFLGNFKKWAGFRREKAPFVLTPEFAHVMGGKGSPTFQKFCDLCCKAYNILRQHKNVFINLFAMMLSTGIPELTSEEDIDYLSTALSFDLTDEEAEKAFTRLIHESLHTKATQINFAIHLLAHPK